MVLKQPGRHNKIRWSYMFETARLAWSKMTFDVNPLQSLEKFLLNATNQIRYPTTEEAWGETAISANRRTSEEARNIAIKMNLELLRKKGDDNDTLCFLRNELYGRRLRLRRPNLSDKQNRLVSRFEDLLDEFDYLCSTDNADVADNKASKISKALLTAERDSLIKQIHYEITKPPEQEEHTLVEEDEPMSADQDNDTPITDEEPSHLSESNHAAIRDFCSFTCVGFDQAQKVLAFYNYNLQEALDFHFEDQKADQMISDSIEIEMNIDSDEPERDMPSSPPSGPSGGEGNDPADDSPMNDMPERYVQSPSKDESNNTKGQEQSTKYTFRRGRSHAGQLILLDAQGNFQSHLQTEPSPRSLWGQYRAMREKLHIQYYGPNTWFDDPDPLRGVPISERADDDDKTVSTVDVEDAGGYKDTKQKKAVMEYRDKQEALRAERTADAADIKMAIELAAKEREAQEKRDHEYARSLHTQLNALGDAGQCPNADGSGGVDGDWETIAVAITLSNMAECAWGHTTECENECKRNNSPAHSEKDFVVGGNKALSKMDLAYIMDQAEETNRQNAEHLDTEPNSTVNPGDLEKMDDQANDAEIEQAKYLFYKQEQEGA
ncbi:hypothetical protein ACET3X_008107 [Alternaria dauci]|uniref:UBA domain-containing protein n=1 Tax=Alternaria dauci TaxID=48095 RepID=A0ABR3U9G4_9PLEO